MKKGIYLLVGFLVLLMLGACGGNKEFDENKVYKVGVDTTYPPFEYQEDGEYKGIDIDLIHAIAEDQGIKIEIEAMDFGGIIPAMQAGELDIGMGGMSITDERKEKVDFSDPYFEAGLSLVVAKDNESIHSLEDLEGKVVVIKNGTTGAKFAEEHKKEHGYETVQVNDSTSMFQEVSNGSADALIEDYPVITYAIAQSGLDLQVVGERLNGDHYGISVLKGKNDELLEKINAGLAALKDSGEYDEIMNTYLGE
ncbi:transporter substrate-binding domain-containing protein [Virgibacillus soli]|uniref:Transporter substrate-binding domain-containing protein n=1 Tax=Paracerasibacillus soli TaxID=480284 RepID=A0ABU5CS82_9BACI|nr:transporter substrate-binding domain-containing protein [Virgibacillus soli]MDY0409100.1 transporter substrate-binding domain-containing protein [Virgibacillus soli]